MSDLGNTLKNKPLMIGLLISLIYFLIHLFIINDYGLSWDFHYHHYAGLHHLGLPVPSIDSQAPAPFTPPDPRLTYDDPFGPFTQILPTLSYVLFFEKLKILSFETAYNLPMVILGSVGVGLLFIILYQAINLPVAIWGSLFLALLPNYFGYLHNNMKDIPNAFAYALSIYTFWRLVKFRRTRDLLLAVVSFAFAFNVKVNSIMIPVILFTWVVLVNISGIVRFISSVVSPSEEAIRPPLRRDLDGIKLVLSYFILAPVAAIALWWPFWNDPLGKLLEIPSFYSQNTLNMPVLFWGKIVKSGVNIPWHYPYSYLLITTPLPILISFIVGLVVSINRIFKIRQSFRNSPYGSRLATPPRWLSVYFSKKSKFYLLLLLWFFLPLLRYFNPKMGAIDGLRHFMEVVYPQSAIAAIGIVWVIKKIGRIREVGIVLGVVLALVLSQNIVHFHPYQTSYFNLLIGGIKGAQGKFDIDFWGTPQKEAMFYLNNHAPANSTLYIVMAQSTASLYLRDDLKKGVNSKDIWNSDYVVVLNRQSFFSTYDIYEYMKEKKESGELVFQKTIDQVPLVWVFKN